jgi:hypothetical protein
MPGVEHSSPQPPLSSGFGDLQACTCHIYKLHYNLSSSYPDLSHMIELTIAGRDEAHAVSLNLLSKTPTSHISNHILQPEAASLAPIAHLINNPLCIPENAVTASREDLFAMSKIDKAILKSRLTAEHLAKMNVLQQADLNVRNIEIPTLGPVDAPIGPKHLKTFTQEAGEVTIITSTTPADRFYAVAFSINFTGVVRGKVNFEAVCPPRRRGVVVLGSGCRLDMERAWCVAYYKKETGVLHE